MRSFKVLVSSILLSAMMGAPALAQERTFRVTGAGSWVLYDDASALDDGPSVGIEAVVPIISFFSVGTNVDFGRTEVNGDFFPAAEINFGPDTTILYSVGQRISILTAGVSGVVSPLTGRFQAYGVGGVGWYKVYFDPQQAGGAGSLDDLMLSVGGGLTYEISDRFGFQIDARDVIFTGWEREALNVVRPRLRDPNPTCLDAGTCRFPDANPPPPDAKGTIHNIRLSVGFRYVPGRP